MRIGLNIGQQSNPLAVHRINSSLAKKTQQIPDQKNEGRKDIVSISPQGKASNFIDSLIKQRQNIAEQKDKLIGSTLEKGGTMDSIQSQLDTYEEQLKNIDTQIAEATAKEAETQTEKTEDKKNSEPKTEQEIENKRLADLTELSTGLQQAEVTASIKDKIDGQGRVLKSEIELDKMRAGSSAGAREMIAKKEESLADLQQHSAKLSPQIGEKLAETVDKIADSNQNEAVVSDDVKKHQESKFISGIPISETNGNVNFKNLSDEYDSPTAEKNEKA